MSKRDKTRLESPEEIAFTAAQLLKNAEHLLESGDRMTIRASVFEAITALEAYVSDQIFSQLPQKVGEPLSKWLEGKTRMDFDTRLLVLIPLATGLPVDKKSRLWGDYKKAKGLRNRIAHTGKTVSQAQARKVIETVYEWLTYLGSASAIPAEASDSPMYERLGRFLAGWAHIERALYPVTSAMSTTPRAIRESRGNYLTSPILSESLKPPEIEELQELRRLRNTLVHGRMEDYKFITPALLRRIERLSSKLGRRKKGGRK
jgi:hypothetical protein